MYSEVQDMQESFALHKQRLRHLISAKCRCNKNRTERKSTIWIPGHSEIYGNEKAKEFGRQRAEDTYLEQETFLGISSK